MINLKKIFKRIFLLICMLCAGVSLQAQDWIGFHSSNYAGINGVNFQPASIADSRFKFQMNLIAFNARISNNYLILKNEALKAGDIDGDSYIESDRASDKGVFGNLHFQLPSFMLTLSPKHAIAFSTRVRTMFVGDNFSEDLSQFIDDIEENGDFTIGLDDRFDIEDVYVQAHAWAEYDLTYARVVMDEEKHFLKAGVTAKYLQGIGSGYAYINKLSYQGVSLDRVDIGEASVSYGASDDDISDDELVERLTNSPTKGFGFDLGVEYEYRPDHEDYKYTMDGEEGLIRRDLNKYKYKIGFALLDVGGIKYDKSPESGDVQTSLNITDLDINALTGDLDDILDSLFVFTRGGSYRMSMPTRFVGQFDYRLKKGIYVNFTSQTALKGGRGDVEKTRYLSTVSLTPRIENRGLGLALPLSYDKFANFNVGASVRMGPLLIGSKGIISGLLGKDISEVDVHFALRWGIPYRKKKDKDNDGVSKRYDQCRKVPGVWEFKGCPDTDSDGIQDSEDECPEVAGVETFKGCPDTDGDGVKDSEDNCPEIAGIPEYKGCPDQDGDGIKDSEDACPEVKGIPEFNGCPDTDGDGIVDSEDTCPELAGPKEKQGCPDSDGDGLHDHEDQCPEQAGPVNNSGCPEEDTDGDGIIDKEDDCPSTAGVPENNGCPVIEKEEQEIIDMAFDNLEFKTGSLVITDQSYTSLDKLAGLMKDKPTWRLLLEGHTDSQGSRAGNIRLSKKRAQAVADYLESKGLEKLRFSVVGHGPDRPIADNSTKAGRQKNRRVEMTIIFD